MQRGTVGQLLINAALPKEFRDYSRKLDAKAVADVLGKVAEKYPDQYATILRRLSDLGRESAYQTGGFSFGLKHLEPSKLYSQLRTEMEAGVQGILRDPAIPKEEKQQRVIDYVRERNTGLSERIFSEALQNDNPLAKQVLSGSRGKPSNLQSLLGGDILYQDHKDRIIPFPVFNSYAQGLSPAEYFAGSFGARKGVLDTKTATQDAGFYCLAEGTQVRMANGSVRNIEHIRVGDRVLGADASGNTFPVSVTATFANGIREVWRYRFRVGKNRKGFEEIIATPQHNVLAIPDRERPGNPSGDIRSILTPTKLPLSRSGIGFRMVLGKDFVYSYVDRECLGDRPTFDIEVDHSDHLFVLANGMIVSNSKQLYQATHRLLVNKLDASEEDGDDDVSLRGLPVDTADEDSVGALLSFPVAGYGRNTIITPKVLRKLRAQGIDKIVVRSPIIGGPRDGGVYARDAGIREKQGLPAPRESIGVAASQSISEPVSQGNLNSKHSGGIAGAAKTVSGFKALNQMTQVPKSYPGGATHAEHSGSIQSIKPSPAGGQIIVINNEEHYVRPDATIKFRVGDEVEAGDQLTDGLPNPAIVVKHKGIGEGRRYFTNEFKRALTDSGIAAERRNVELVARGLINHVRFTSEHDQYLPDDVVTYDRLESFWEPREHTQLLPVDRAQNQYLEVPVLHHSIGAKLTPKVLKEMKDLGIKEIYANSEPPPFEPEMIRGLDNLQHDPDWFSRFLGSNQKKSTLRAVHRGDTSDAAGTSFVPALANPVNFGRSGMMAGYDPKEVIKAPAGFKDDEKGVIL